MGHPSDSLVVAYIDDRQLNQGILLSSSSGGNEAKPLILPFKSPFQARLFQTPLFSEHLLKGVVEVALDCAHRATPSFQDAPSKLARYLFRDGG